MDLGLSGRSAIVCAASRGLGLACAQALAAEAGAVTITGRNPAWRAAAAQIIRDAVPTAQPITALGISVTRPSARSSAARRRGMTGQNIVLDGGAFAGML